VSFNKLINEIRRKPALYLSRNTIFDFNSFLLGYQVARIELGFPETEEERDFYVFLDYIREICPVKTDHTWANLVLFYSADERDALNKLFGLWDDYNERKKFEAGGED
jgi:hypothetical protein